MVNKLRKVSRQYEGTIILVGKIVQIPLLKLFHFFSFEIGKTKSFDIPLGPYSQEFFSLYLLCICPLYFLKKSKNTATKIQRANTAETPLHVTTSRGRFSPYFLRCISTLYFTLHHSSIHHHHCRSRPPQPSTMCIYSRRDYRPMALRQSAERDRR